MTKRQSSIKKILLSPANRISLQLFAYRRTPTVNSCSLVAFGQKREHSMVLSRWETNFISTPPVSILFHSHKCHVSSHPLWTSIIALTWSRGCYVHFVQPGGEHSPRSIHAAPGGPLGKTVWVNEETTETQIKSLWILRLSSAVGLTQLLCPQLLSAAWTGRVCLQPLILCLFPSICHHPTVFQRPYRFTVSSKHSSVRAHSPYSHWKRSDSFDSSLYTAAMELWVAFAQ